MRTSWKRYLAAFAALAVIFAAPAGAFAARDNSQKPFSVDADEVEYDMETGDGKTVGVTTIKHDGRTTTAQEGGTFNSNDKSGHLYGGIKSNKGDEHMTSDELVMYNEDFISAVGNAVITKGDKTLYAPRVDYHDDTKFAETLGGQARLTATDGSWLIGSKITYDMNTEIADATGHVQLASPPQNLTGFGDRAIFNNKEGGYVELIGNASATQDGNTVTGKKLRITNTKKTRAQGNVNIVFQPEDGSGGRLASVPFGQGARNIARGNGRLNPEITVVDKAAGVVQEA